MSLIKITGSSSGLTYRQRWSGYFVFIYAALALFIGVNLRDSALNAVTVYTNTQAGIRVEYPNNWLLDEEDDYVFRVRDVARIGFKTTLQVAVQPVGAGTTARNVLDGLSLRRAPTLAGYSVLSYEPYTLPDESEAIRMTYVFVATEEDPFLESVPVVVEGTDILAIRRGQAVIITFLSDGSLFNENLPYFERFINALEF